MKPFCLLLLGLLIIPTTHALDPMLKVDLGDQGQLLVLNLSDHSQPWYLLDGPSGSVSLGEQLAGFYQVHALSVSPDQRYLAVLSAAEGHPLVEVFDLPALLQQQSQTPLYQLNPYPGAIELIGWQQQSLLVASNVPLDQLQQEAPDASMQFDHFQSYQLMLESGQFSPINLSQ